MVAVLALVAPGRGGLIDAEHGHAAATQHRLHLAPRHVVVRGRDLAGAAGVLALAIQKTATMVGVFISVTTVPAAGNLALGLALGEPGEIGARWRSWARTSPA